MAKFVSKRFQVVVPAGKYMCTWLDGASAAEEFCLTSAVVAPGYEFGDDSAGSRDDLVAKFPKQRELIERMTPDPGQS